MAMYVNTNVSSLNGQRNLQNVTDRMNSSFEKLSSGSRINSARDDAAGLQISDRLSTQLTGLSQGNRNANDGISIAQIAEGALSEVTNNVQRMRQLVVQGGNRTLSSEDRAALGDEFKKLVETNDSIAERTAYGSIKLLNYDSQEDGFQIQSGAQAGQQDTITTGNAKLTSLFGDILTAEGSTGDLVSIFSTALSNTAKDNILNNAGTLGKLVVAHMTQNTAAESLNTIGNAFNALFGGAASAALVAATVSTLATNSALQLDTQALTNLLTADVKETAHSVTGDLATLQALGSIASQRFLGMTSASAPFNTAGVVVGFSDAQLNTVNAFATDTLLDMMSGLVTEVDKTRSKLGAEQNGLASTVRSNTAAIVNVSDARSRIMDTDFATETAELTRNQIIQQAATSILSQANQLPNAALSLLR